MTPERWQQIDQLLEKALQQEPVGRNAFLDEACVGDEELRREVAGLLAAHDKAGSVLSSPALGIVNQTSEDSPQSLRGRSLSHYQILSRLGEGGMGIVYKARDSHLDRFVAIKVLPPELMTDPDRKRRFVQEAKAASALNHPNIITVHDISNHDGMDFIVMEYVEGKTLTELIPRRGLKLSELLKYAIQIADALAKAHHAGIIHRDLKPGNIMVSEGGLVKVLDFGLAKLVETSVTNKDAATHTIIPPTEEGIILGTASYMSPEQAAGQATDARSDIFSFGSVLYEMVTGQRAFEGDSKMSTLAAILNKDPKRLTELSDRMPADLGKIISRCLRKAPERRWQHMADLKVALEDLKEESVSDKLGVEANSQRAQRGRLWLAGFTILCLVAPLAVWLARSTGKAPFETPMVAVPLTSYPGEERQPSFSPDGNQVAFSWNEEKDDNFDIYVKQIPSGAQLRLTTAPQNDSCPAWSPDGSFIAFIREGPEGKDSVYLISPLGPPERRVAEISPNRTHWPRGLTWTPDAKSLIVADSNSDREPLGLFVLSVESGDKRRLTTPPDKLVFDSQPAFSPDGHTLAFVREVAIGVRDIYQLTLSEHFEAIGEAKRLTFENRLNFAPTWTSAGQEIVFSSGLFLNPNLFRIAASGSTKPQRLSGVGEDGSELAISSRTHRLVYTRELIDENIWRLELPGPHETINPPTKLISSTRIDEHGQYSPDGNKIAFSSNRTGSFEIWICDSDGSNAQRLTSLSVYSGSPQWSPDGEQIAFSSIREQQWEVYVINANGGQPKRLTNSPAYDYGPSWSRDGKWIYFSSDRSGESQVWKMPGGGGAAIQVTRKGGGLAFESLDGQWLYYAKARGLWKMPTDGGEETEVLESVFRETFAVVGEGIYFIPRPDAASHNSIQFFDFATKNIRSISAIGMPQDYVSVSPDGHSILYSQRDEMGSDLMLVENFK